MSFSIALSGLSASNTELNNISNNIANVTTSGFKGARAEFASVYNGQEAGGVEVTGISQNFDKSGSITGTGRALDMAISGSGFFVTEDAKGQTMYTRSGIINMDSDGTLVSNSGAALQGYPVDGNNNLQQGTVGDLVINTQSLQAEQTTNLDFIANLDARETSPINAFDDTDSTTFNHSYTTPVYDSLGNQHTVTQYFVKTATANEWEVHLKDNSTNTSVGPETITFNSDGTLDTSSLTSFTFTPPNGADPVNINIALTGMTQFGSDFSVSTNNPNGYGAGDYAGLRVENDGSIYASYTNGQSQLQGQVVLANFTSPQELVKTSDTAWLQSFSSGVPVIGTAGTGVFGDLTSGALEGSNVDLTSELVNLMTAQRNYQANTKSISTSDQLTQALFNVV
ncbi:flagellar basal body protein FlgE [Vibrio sp. SS-MA-C1-2]|uniref:flagellar hook protein FlgE n=1 Tax=Vibrio sp. SS-MA-C1-2 TaxID=2908646 RepID=UPI001F1A5F11|nr:flagellar hook protein FlgE [Vibrio sp. SS-MA-C1-2]UJF18020.1 flagellar basal body protein FlgE [Vibrio sp. SS-MA-C1-2]